MSIKGNDKMPWEEWSMIRVIMLVIQALVFIGSGVLHIINPRQYTNMMPKFMPIHIELIYISGVAMIAGGIGLLIPQTRKIAAWGILLLHFSIFPACITMAIHNPPI